MQAYDATGSWSTSGTVSEEAEIAVKQALSGGRTAWTTNGRWESVPENRLPTDLAAVRQSQGRGCK